MERTRVPIDGMTCTSCVARITRAVRKVPGVASVRVDLVSDSATVAFDPARVSLAAIGAAIEAAGYGPRIEDAVPDLEVASRPFLGRFGLRR